MNTERLKNAALILCLFIVLVVIFSSYFRASEVGTFFGALAGTPLLVHVFNRLAPKRPHLRFFDGLREGTGHNPPAGKSIGD